jgi:hypothetical protein
MRLPQLSIVVLLFACVATAACGCRFAKDDDVRQMGQSVETALPLGSTPAQVTKFLDDQHIKNGHGGWQFYDTHRYDGLEQIEGNIQGGRSDTPAGNLLFFFRDGKLVEWWVESDCGGGCYSMRGNKSSYKNTNAGFSDCYER